MRHMAAGGLTLGGAGARRCSSEVSGLNGVRKHDGGAWYNSCEYENISRLYAENAMDLALADGVSPDFTMAGFAQGSAHVARPSKE